MLLWSLFPSFCVSPQDIPTAFNPQLGQLLTKAVTDARYDQHCAVLEQPAHPHAQHVSVFYTAIHSYPQLSSVICGGIKVLIQRNLIASGTLPHGSGANGQD